MERQISKSGAEFCQRGAVLPGDIVQELEAAVPALLRQIRRVTEVRIGRHQHGRHCGVLVAKNCPRLFEITRGESELIDQRGREYMRIVHAECLGLKRIMNSK